MIKNAMKTPDAFFRVLTFKNLIFPVMMPFKPINIPINDRKNIINTNESIHYPPFANKTKRMPKSIQKHKVYAHQSFACYL
jgi:hypothetical protein